MTEANPVTLFQEEKKQNIALMASNGALRKLSDRFLVETHKSKYSYNFTWLGRPIIQFPQDIIALQEIIWDVKPDLIIETGIAHGGSIIFSASMLELIGGNGRVVGIDLDIRNHNRAEIEKHPMFKKITMLEGSSVEPRIVAEVTRIASGKKPVMVVLDSNHTHDHVLKELELYSPFVTKNSYLVVMDTIVEDLPDSISANRPWGKGNNPKTAVWEFMRKNDRFEINKEMENKLLLTVAPDGFLRCVKD